MNSVIKTIHNGKALKFIFLPVVVVVFFFMFIKLENNHSFEVQEETITIPLQSYTLQKEKKLQEIISPEQIIEKGKGRQVAGTDDIEEAYLGVVQAEVNKQKRFPPYELRLGAEDDVQIRIVILPNGSVASFEILNKSKFAGFNQEVERMIENAFLPPFPQGLDKENLAIVFFIRFKIDDR